MAMQLNPSLSNWIRRPFNPPFLIDNVPNPTAAFSQRRLTSSYSGPLIRVRRSSDNTESDIGFDSAGNLDQAALLSFVGAGSGFVTIFYDQMGTGAQFGQATTGAQPRIVNAGVVDVVNNRPAMLYDGSNDTLTGNATANAILQNRTGMSLLAVNNYLSFAGSNRSLCSFSTNTSTATLRLSVTGVADAGSTAQRGFNARALDANGLSQRTSASKYDGTLAVNCYTIDYTTASGVNRRNGVVIDSGTFASMSGGITTNLPSLGSAMASFNATQFAQMNIGDMLFYPRVLTAYEMTFAERNMGAYYGITI